MLKHINRKIRRYERKPPTPLVVTNVVSQVFIQKLSLIWSLGITNSWDSFLDCPACGPSPVAQVKNPPANAGDESSSSGSGRSTRKGKWLPTPASYLRNLMDGGAWQATVYRVTKESCTTYWLNNNHQHVQPKKWGLHGVKSSRRRYSRYDLPFWDCSIKPANHMFHHSEHPLKKDRHTPLNHVIMLMSGSQNNIFLASILPKNQVSECISWSGRNWLSLNTLWWSKGLYLGSFNASFVNEEMNQKPFCQLALKQGPRVTTGLPSWPNWDNCYV